MNSRAFSLGLSKRLVSLTKPNSSTIHQARRRLIRLSNSLVAHKDWKYLPSKLVFAFWAVTLIRWATTDMSLLLSMSYTWGHIHYSVFGLMVTEFTLRYIIWRRRIYRPGHIEHLIKTAWAKRLRHLPKDIPQSIVSALHTSSLVEQMASGYLLDQLSYYDDICLDRLTSDDWSTLWNLTWFDYQARSFVRTNLTSARLAKLPKSWRANFLAQAASREDRVWIIARLTEASS